MSGMLELNPPEIGKPTGPCAPAVRHFARLLGVDLSQVKGTGPKGRLGKDDVIAFVRRSMRERAAPAPSTAPLDLLPWPQVDFARFGPIERRPKGRIQALSGRNLARNWVMIPHVTNFDEADITELDAFRQQHNATAGADRLTLLPFLVKAVVHTLQAFPAFNVSLDGNDVVEKRYWHVGFAADTPHGLVVPVVRDADRKSVRELARECAELAARARAGRLAADEMQGGCFTISSLGAIGGTGFTPIINAPEVAILGVTRAVSKARWDGAAFQPRSMLPLCLSWDHRAVDGVAAARFLVHLAAILGDVRRLLL